MKHRDTSPRINVYAVDINIVLEKSLSTSMAEQALYPHHATCHFRFATIGLVLLALVLPQPAVAAESVWKITSLEWPPYASSQLPEGGSAIAELRALLKQHDIRLEVTYMPWEQAQQLAQTGDYIGYYPAWPSEVKNGFIASAALAFSQLAVITLQDKHINFTNVVQLLSNHKIGTVSSYIYPDNVQLLLQEFSANLVAASSETELLRLLQNGTVDIAVTAPEVMKNMAAKHNSPALKVLSQFEDQPLVLAIKDNNSAAETQAWINAYIAAKAPAQPNYKKPHQLLASHFNLPGVQPFKDFIQQVYQEIGIKVKFAEAPGVRGFLMLNTGLTDIDVVRIKGNAQRFHNIQIVEPGLAIGEIRLICAQQIPCNLAVLADKNISILANKGNLMALDEFNIQAKIIYNETIPDMIDILRKRNIKYAVIGSVKGYLDQYAQEFQMMTLRTVELNHVVHKKHAALLPELQQAIEKRLKTTPFLLVQ